MFNAPMVRPGGTWTRFRGSPAYWKPTDSSSSSSITRMTSSRAGFLLVAFMLSRARRNDAVRRRVGIIKENSGAPVPGVVQRCRLPTHLLERAPNQQNRRQLPITQALVEQVDGSERLGNGEKPPMRLE